MKRKVGVFFDGFDPVNAGHLEAALSAAGKLGLSFVLMGLLSGKAEESYGIRWRMLVAACSDTANLIPVRTEQECIAERMEFLQGKYPDDELVIISEPADTVSGFNNMIVGEIRLGSRNVCFGSISVPLPVIYFSGRFIWYSGQDRGIRQMAGMPVFCIEASPLCPFTFGCGDCPPSGRKIWGKSGKGRKSWTSA